MLTLGIILAVIGVLVAVFAAVTPVPSPIPAIGWVALGIGLVLVVLAYALPLIPAAPAAMALTL